MQAKGGKKISAVKPIAPEKVFDADEADPGKVEKVKAEQIKKQAGKYGKQPVKPFKKPAEEGKEEETKKSWIEIEMVDEADEPVPGLKYEVELPDGSVASGVLDNKGFARLDGIEPGNCKITFPDLDGESWEKA